MFGSIIWQDNTKKKTKKKTRSVNIWQSFKTIWASLAYTKCATFPPWCKHWGRSCEQHLQGRVLPLGPGSSSVQTRHGRSNSAPTHPLHLCTPAARPYQCGAWRQKEGRHRIYSTLITLNLETRSLSFISGNEQVQIHKYIMEGYLALSMFSVLCTLLSCPRQKRSPPDGST